MKKTLIELMEQAEARERIISPLIQKLACKHEKVHPDPKAIANLDRLLATPMPRPPGRR